MLNASAFKRKTSTRKKVARLSKPYDYQRGRYTSSTHHHAPDTTIQTHRYERNRWGDLSQVDGPSTSSQINASHREEALSSEGESDDDGSDESQDEIIMTYAAHPDDAWEDEEDGDSPEKAKKALPSGRKPGRKRAMDVWAGRIGGRIYAQEFLYELLRLKGRGTANTKTCNACGSNGGAVYRCRECAPSRLICKSCCVKEHATTPLHIIQTWDGEKFIKVTLRSMGLRVFLGHEDGTRCFMPRADSHPLVVIHVNGIHEVSVRYCNCLMTKPRRQQLLRFGWYPATVHLPATCATLQVLDLFQGLNLNGKLAGYSFYKTLVYLTDALGIHVPKKRYQPLLRMIRQYRHLLMLMRAGKGAMKNGATKLESGELCLQCPACPNPYVNLPADWRTRVDQYLYRGIYSLDACFRLTSLLGSNQSNDPSLHPSAAFMLDDTGAYGLHVLKHASQKDISTCSGFKALAHAESKTSTGLRCTGVLAAICSRHEFVSPQGVGNLQKGERFCNTDFIALMALLRLHALLMVLFSYDIACQWIINFAKRMEQLPEEMRLPDTMDISSAIPKGHCPGHQWSCQSRYGMGIQPGVGRTDGEAIERVWAFIRACASSIKEMGPGSRADTLDDQFQYHNWCKLISLGFTFLRRLVKAKAQALKHGGLHADFSAHLPPETVAAWTEGVERWEADMDNEDNPYVKIVKRETEAQIRLRLKEEERLALEQGAMVLHETSATSCLCLALGIEDMMHKLRLLTDGEGTLTVTQATHIQKQRVSLEKRIRLLRSVQQVYMPGVAAEWRRESVARRYRVEVEDTKLWLPSDFCASNRTVIYLSDIDEKEKALRIGQCGDALDAMRDCERSLRNLVSYRRDETNGQGAVTRAQGFIKTIEARRDLNAEKYRRARRALQHLDPDGTWSTEFKPLRDADISNMEGGVFDLDVLLPLGQGATELSWVWAHERGHTENDFEACHLEWLKSRARSRAWTFEVKMLQEEMRRTPISLESRAAWWATHGENDDPDVGDDIREGIRAYAAGQVHILRTMVDSFRSMWEAGGIDLEDDWDELNDPEEGGESEDDTFIAYGDE